MARLFEKMKDLMFGEDDYDDEDYIDDYDDAPPVRERNVVDYQPQERSYGKRNANTSQVVSIHTNVQMQVVIIKPECYEDAQEICDQVKSKKPVVVNLEKVEYPIAQRIMDFLSGTCYSLDGTIQRVANNIFIIAPENVDISGDFKEELKTKGIILPWVSSGK